MPLTLVETRPDSSLRSHRFDGDRVVLGRDETQCQLVIDKADWPMVSRRHAELTWRDGALYLHDLQSSSGTFLNGEQVVAPTQVFEGSKMQLGYGGPVLTVQLGAAPLASALARDEVTDIGLPSPPTAANPARRADVTQTLQAPRPAVAQASAAPTHATQAAHSTPAAHTSTSSRSATVTRQAGAFIDVLGPQSLRIDIQVPLLSIGRDDASDIKLQAHGNVVSRKHAEIAQEGAGYLLRDLGGFNGSFVNERRVVVPTALADGDSIQIGVGGPLLRFHSGAVGAGVNDSTASKRKDETLFVKSTGSTQSHQPSASDFANASLLYELVFPASRRILVGRGKDNDVVLDGLHLSNHHAQLTDTASGVMIDDLGSTNGTYVRGERVSRQYYAPGDTIHIGGFLIQIDAQKTVRVFDARARTRIDCLHIGKEVPAPGGKGNIRLLDDISLTIGANEFVGLLGPSGAGKSTLMDAMNGMRPPTAGQVLFNARNYYDNLDAMKQSIGYVPQDDIIHRELTVYRTLHYVARLRLSADVSANEANAIIEEVLEVTGLSERRDVPVSQLSGGQRKRVSIAVELITKPSVIFLDEPTSGLDPGTEEKIMKLFRYIADSGRTVIMTTHAMENVVLFDKVVMLMRGKLAFYGTPKEALAHLKASSFKDIYEKLEEPVDERMKKFAGQHADAAAEAKLRARITEEVAEEWKTRFRQTEQYRRYVAEPSSNLGAAQTKSAKSSDASAQAGRTRLGFSGGIRQFANLSRRYLEVLLRDKLTLAILFGQAPIVALLTYLVVDAKQPRDFIYFVLTLVAIWFGTSIAAREIIRERPVFNRERMVNLALFPYIASKLAVLGLLVGVQCLLLFVPLKLMDVSGAMPMPGLWAGLPHFGVMLLTAFIGISFGLLISALVKTSEMATSLVPLVLIPQILFSGLVGVPYGMSRAVGAAMPVTWSFDSMKRLSDLSNLRLIDSAGERKTNCLQDTDWTKNCGLYAYVESANSNIVANAKRDLDGYKTGAQKDLDDYKKQMETYQDSLKKGKQTDEPKAPAMKPAPIIQDAMKIPEDLSKSVEFQHPWMSVARGQLVLWLMFLLSICATVFVLKRQDVR